MPQAFLAVHCKIFGAVYTAELLRDFAKVHKGFLTILRFLANPL